MTNICAAIGLAQLERAEAIIAKKRALAQTYREKLAGLPVQLLGESGEAFSSFWMNSILVSNASDRDSLREHLAGQGIETRPVFYPVHTMPMYVAHYQRYPVAEDLAWRGINLPSWPGLSSAQVKQITSCIRDYFSTRPAT